jgi:hypothetical protein
VLAWTRVLALTAVPVLAAVPFGAALPFRALACLRWAWARACRARLDFDAVIRASPPVWARLVA